MARKKPPAYYAVHKGRIPGVYRVWKTEGQYIGAWNQIYQHRGAKHCGFETLAEAEYYVQHGCRIGERLPNEERDVSPPSNNSDRHRSSPKQPSPPSQHEVDQTYPMHSYRRYESRSPPRERRQRYNHENKENMVAGRKRSLEASQPQSHPPAPSPPPQPVPSQRRWTEYHAVASGGRPGIYLGEQMRDEHLEANAGAMCFTTTRYEHAIKFLRGGEDEACTSYHVVFVPALQSGAIFTSLEAAEEVYKDREDNRIELGIATIKDADRVLQILISCARSHMPHAITSVSQAAPLAPLTEEAQEAPEAPVKQDSRFDRDFARRDEIKNLDPGSQAYIDKRTYALERELMAFFLPKPRREKDGLTCPHNMTEEHRLIAYKAICRTVGVEPWGTAEECAYAFRTQVLVDPTDLVNAKRTQSRPRVELSSWEKFSALTNAPERRIEREAAGAFLAGLLRDQPDAKALWERERGNWEEGRQLREKGTVSNLRGAYVRKLNKYCNSLERVDRWAPEESAAKRIKVEDNGWENATNGDAGAISCP